MLLKCICGFLIWLGVIPLVGAQSKPPAMPPAKVVVSEAKAGMIAPQSEFIGTVYYQEVSDVATEISGLVETVNFEEGQEVSTGQLLVQLGSDILQKRVITTRSNYEQVLADLEQAQADYRRTEKLYSGNSVAEKVYDENRFRVKGLEKRAAGLKAEVERLKLELSKKKIRAPFDGIVIKKQVDRGEWVSVGARVAVVAKIDTVDIVVEVPQRIIAYITKAMDVKLSAGGHTFAGKVVAIIPRGDIATRTFPVKIRARNSLNLIEGMEATASLPTTAKQETLIVPRDAVISRFGKKVVFKANETKAQMIPVRIIGYDGLWVGIQSDALKNGSLVVVKGNERLQNGQPLQPIKAK